MSHTPGPLAVRVSDKWPFNIETINQKGEIVFSRGMPCYSTAQKSAREALSGKGMERDHVELAKEANRQALADEVLRAAAPELLEALKLCEGNISLLRVYGEWLTVVRAAIAKATGGQHEL